MDGLAGDCFLSKIEPAKRVRGEPEVEASRRIVFVWNCRLSLEIRKPRSGGSTKVSRALKGPLKSMKRLHSVFAATKRNKWEKRRRKPHPDGILPRYNLRAYDDFRDLSRAQSLLGEEVCLKRSLPATP